MIDPDVRVLIQAVIDSASDGGCDDDVTVASKSAINALAEATVRASQEEFVSDNGRLCPFCRHVSLEYSGCVDFIGSTARHDVECLACKEKWMEVYTLTGYEVSTG